MRKKGELSEPEKTAPFSKAEYTVKSKFHRSMCAENGMASFIINRATSLPPSKLTVTKKTLLPTYKWPIICLLSGRHALFPADIILAFRASNSPRQTSTRHLPKTTRKKKEINEEIILSLSHHKQMLSHINVNIIDIISRINY